MPTRAGELDLNKDTTYTLTFTAPTCFMAGYYHCFPEIRDVKFSKSKRTGKITTIVFFADGSKRMATPMDGDSFNKEEGINQCILKKLFGCRSQLKKFYKQWKYKEES